MRPQDKFIDKAPHLIRQQGSPEIWRKGGHASVKEALAFDKALIRKPISQQQIEKIGETG